MTAELRDLDPAALAFDFDGVVVESTDIKAEAFLELFVDHPQHHPAILAHHLDHLGISRYRKFEWIYRELLGRPLGAAESKRLGRRYSRLVVDRTVRCPLVPGALECLREVAGRLPVFLVSGTPDAELRTIVERRELTGYFRAVHGGPRSKESILSEILTRQRLSAARLLVVGDGLSDLRAARAVGARFLARRTPGRYRNRWPAGVEVIADLHPLRRALAAEP